MVKDLVHENGRIVYTNDPELNKCVKHNYCVILEAGTSKSMKVMM